MFDEQNDEDDVWPAACVYMYEGWVSDDSNHNGRPDVRTYSGSMVN